MLLFDRSEALSNDCQCYWQWHIEQIENVPIADNVVELLFCKTEKSKTNTYLEFCKDFCATLIEIDNDELISRINENSDR